MTRKDYILIAEAIKKHVSNHDAAWRERLLAEAIADALAADNPRFDRERFLRAAGVQS